MKALKICICMILVNFSSSAWSKSYSKSIEVGSGNHGIHTITQTAVKGDVLSVSFTAKEGFELCDADFDDPGDLGWQRTGSYSFRLTLLKDLDPKVNHKADFHGTVKRISEGERISEGGGKGEEEKLEWDLIGQFKVLGHCEGVGSDQGRMPVAKMETEKPKNEAVTTGEVTYKIEADGAIKYIGTFIDGAVGAYTGLPYGNVPKKQLKTEEKECPEDTTIQVDYVYYVVDENSGRGSLISPDTIKLNSFSVEDEIKEKTEIMDEQQKLVDSLNDDIKSLEQEIGGLDDEYTTIEKARQTYLDDTVNSNVSVLNDEVVKAQAIYDGRVADGALASRIAGALKKLNKKKATLKKAKLKNEQLVKKEKIYIDYTADMEGIDAQRIEKKSELTALFEERNREQRTLGDLSKEVISLTNVQNGWDPEHVLNHELEHRRIAEYYGDKMTDYMNTFQAWGYAKNVNRADDLAKLHYGQVYTSKIKEIMTMSDKMQVKFDKDTKHNGLDAGPYLK